MFIVSTKDAPETIGPYSQACVHGGMLFVSGQLPSHPAAEALVSEDVGVQAHQCIANIEAIVKAAGAKLSDTVKTTIYLTDLADFATVNHVYGSLFATPYPARACIQVAALPRGAKVEIDAVVGLDLERGDV